MFKYFIGFQLETYEAACYKNISWYRLIILISMSIPVILLFFKNKIKLMFLYLMETECALR